MFRFILEIIVLATIASGLPTTSDIKTAEYFGNDMIIPPRPKGVAAIPQYYYRWPNGTVPYVMASSIAPIHQALIIEQMRAMENMTRVNGVNCITFRDKVAGDNQSFITIQNGSGCSATLGYNSGWQGNRTLNLLHTPTATCMITGTIQHELLHVLGFFHEQSRPDRDQYVQIQWSNVMAGYEHNFVIYNESRVDTQQTPYDFGSVMHYDVYAFAINSSQPTTIPIQATNTTIGQRVKMSPIDILEVQRYYGCVPPAPTTTTTAGAAPTTTTTAGAAPTTTTTAGAAPTTTTTAGAAPSTTTKTTTTSRTTTTTTTRTTTSVTTTSTTTSNNTTPNGDHMVADTAETFFVSYLMICVSIFIHLIE